MKLITALASLALASTAFAAEWLPLFNGKDLEGWTIKVAKHDIGDNFADTFQVEDGILKVSYEAYDSFDMQVAHLYTNSPYSHYRLRLEYKFVDPYMADAPFWSKRNSGVMLHSQSPLSMARDQAFPVSVEAQFLATGTEAGKQTGNAATPGTHLERSGQHTTDHIIEADSQLYPVGEWVRFEAEVRGNDEIVYFVNGNEVLRYQHPQLDPDDADAAKLLNAGATKELRQGHIALQAEGQAVWFRNVEIQPISVK